MITGLKTNQEFRIHANIQDDKEIYKNFYQKQHAIKNYLKQYQMNTTGENDLLSFLDKIRMNISILLEKEINLIGSLKFSIAVRTA